MQFEIAEEVATTSKADISDFDRNISCIVHFLFYSNPAAATDANSNAKRSSGSQGN
jgi:hypothetical protein